MITSIIEHVDGTSFVVVSGQDGEHHVFDIMETDSRDDLGQIEYESFQPHVVFHYSLLGDPNADAEEIHEVCDSEEELSEFCA